MEVKDAVKQLTKPHHAVIGDQTVEREPLLDLLHQARYSSSGVKGVKTSNRGLPIDVGAISMWETFDGKVRAALNSHGLNYSGELKECTQRLHNGLIAINIEEGLDPREFDLFSDMVRKIEDFFDPPKQYEIMGECPECEATHTVNDDGEQSIAIVIQLRPGHALIAECQACGKMWAGNKEMLWLAQLLQANSDWDTLEVLGLTSM